MARKKCLRHIECAPGTVYYKPAGIRLIELEEVILELDEFEAIKLADLEELYQEDAAEKMKISRPTFGRIIASAHKKIADALVNGKAIKISGGNVISADFKKNKGELNENCCPHKK
jgi:predicted DNA-binding protein (UPF0251 family)